MKPISRRRCIAAMRAVNAECASISALAASAMLELGLLRRNVKEPCLLHTPSRGTMKAAVFEQCFEEELLNCLPKGHLIIMDNAAFHKKEVLQNRARKYSQKLIFLPPYSPEYNPIEHTWSALKRRVAGCVHLCASVSLALDTVLEGN